MMPHGMGYEGTSFILFLFMIGQVIQLVRIPSRKYPLPLGGKYGCVKGNKVKEWVNDLKLGMRLKTIQLATFINTPGTIFPPEGQLITPFENMII